MLLLAGVLLGGWSDRRCRHSGWPPISPALPVVAMGAGERRVLTEAQLEATLDVD
jgi:hypothetical protein